jgi:predicted O-methyltransferase YrrM
MEIIAALLRDVEAKSCLEFGCRDGRTARVLLHNVSSLERYVGVDVPMSYEPQLEHQFAEMHSQPGILAARDPRFELMILEHGTLDLEPQSFKESFDACYIDGDHSERVVLHDSMLAGALVKPGGVIVWHDYHEGQHVEVRLVIDKLVDKGWPIKQVSGTWLAFCKVPE